MYIYVCVCVCVCVCKFYIDFIRASKIFNFWFEALFKLNVLLKRNVHSFYKIEYYFVKYISFVIESVESHVLI